MIAAPKTKFVGSKGHDMKSKVMKPMHSAKDMKQMMPKAPAKPAPKPAPKAPAKKPMKGY